MNPPRCECGRPTAATPTRNHGTARGCARCLRIERDAEALRANGGRRGHEAAIPKPALRLIGAACDAFLARRGIRRQPGYHQFPSHD